MSRGTFSLTNGLLLIVGALAIANLAASLGTRDRPDAIHAAVEKHAGQEISHFTETIDQLARKEQAAAVTTKSKMDRLEGWVSNLE